MTAAVTAFGTSVLAFVRFGQARWRESMGKDKKRAREILGSLQGEPLSALLQMKSGHWTVRCRCTDSPASTEAGPAALLSEAPTQPTSQSLTGNGLLPT
jgi:hypothetical protein